MGNKEAALGSIEIVELAAKEPQKESISKSKSMSKSEVIEKSRPEVKKRQVNPKS